MESLLLLQKKSPSWWWIICLCWCSHNNPTGQNSPPCVGFLCSLKALVIFHILEAGFVSWSWICCVCHVCSLAGSALDSAADSFSSNAGIFVSVGEISSSVIHWSFLIIFSCKFLPLSRRDFGEQNKYRFTSCFALPYQRKAAASAEINTLLPQFPFLFSISDLFLHCLSLLFSFFFTRCSFPLLFEWIFCFCSLNWFK